MLVVLVLLSQNVSLGNPACRKVSPGGLARLQRKNLNLTEALQQNHSLLETDQEHTAISVNSKIMLNAIQYKRQESRRILWQDYITLLAKNATVRRGARNWEETAQKLASLWCTDWIHPALGPVKKLSGRGRLAFGANLLICKLRGRGLTWVEKQWVQHGDDQVSTACTFQTAWTGRQRS